MDHKPATKAQLAQRGKHSAKSVASLLSEVSANSARRVDTPRCEARELPVWTTDPASQGDMGNPSQMMTVPPFECELVPEHYAFDDHRFGNALHYSNWQPSYPVQIQPPQSDCTALMYHQRHLDLNGNLLTSATQDLIVLKRSMPPNLAADPAFQWENPSIPFGGHNIFSRSPTAIVPSNAHTMTPSPRQDIVPYCDFAPFAHFQGAHDTSGSHAQFAVQPVVWDQVLRTQGIQECWG